MKDEQKWNQMVPELTVSHFKKSLYFYTEILGFKVRFTRQDPDFAYLYFETAQIMLEQFHAEGWNVAELKAPFGRGINLQIELQNIDAIYQRLLQSNTAIYQEITINHYQTEEDMCEQKEFLVQDPDGYMLRFCQIVD